MTNFLRWLGSTIGPQFILGRLFGIGSSGGVKSWFSQNNDGTFRFSLNSFKDWLDNPFKQISGLVDSFVNSTFSSGRTQQQIEQDEYTAAREDTSYQRKVADMQAAGINPALLYQSGAGSPSVNTAASPSPSAIGLSDILQLAMLPMQMKAMQADIDNTNAQTKKTIADTEGQNISNQYLALLNQAEIDSKRARSELDRKRLDEVSQNISESKQRINLLIKQAATEEEKRNLLLAQEYLDYANAYQIYSLLPYEEALKSSQTALNRSETEYTLVQKLYQQNLIDSGYIEALSYRTFAEANKEHADAKVSSFKAWLSSDQFGRDNESGFERALHSLVSGIYGAVQVISPFK